MKTMKIRHGVQFFLLALLVAAIIVGVIEIQKPAHFPIQTVKIEAPFVNLSQEELEQAIQPYVQVGFFALRVGELQLHLERLQWVAEVDIYRVWPGIIKIKLREEKARFRWRHDSLINQQGDLFHPSSEQLSRFLYLPHLIGPIGFETKVLQNYENMSKMLDKNKLSIVELSLSDRLAWSLVLDSGTKVLIGRNEPLKRVQRFVTMYHAIESESAKQAARVDLRYPHGIAVRWQAGK